jgi:adenosyl cobinamide kinase/adenosyl cobinamide phosphate guanylyltransferase
VTVTLVLGGARSGKSDAAERMALAHRGPITYLATGVATDADMAARIAEHRDRRDARFTTVEAGDDLVGRLASIDGLTLVDSLGTWVASTWSHDDDRFTADADALAAAVATRDAPTILVSDEVGLSVHPESPAGRRFRDALGVVNRAVADVADDVWLVVAGRGLHLDRLPDPGTAGTAG